MEGCTFNSVISKRRDLGLIGLGIKQVSRGNLKTNRIYYIINFYASELMKWALTHGNFCCINFVGPQGAVEFLFYLVAAEKPIWEWE